MTYTKTFSALAIVISSLWVGYTYAYTGDTIKYEKLLVREFLKPRIDTLVRTPEELALLEEYIPYEPNEVIQDRLSCIESEIPLEFNNYVRNFIDYFTIRNRKYSRRMIERENIYFPLYERYLKKYDMPQELKYLSVVESGLNPRAVSPVGAGGLWQFMSYTGKEYGLKVQNQYIDERFDPEKATDAALRFLRRLHKTYDDWELAMAAYNCGPGNVNKAIRRAGGGKKTFWEIFPYLPRETRGYVPSMTAVIYTMNYASEHNIFSDSILYAVKTDTMIVNHALDLEKLAVELHVSTNELIALNPEVRQKVLPESIRNYPLRIPANRTALLANNRSCILLAASPTPLAPAVDDNPLKAPALLASANSETPASKDTVEKKTYVVRNGDNLTQIASRHNVTVAQLKEWNNISGNNIHPKQELIILQPSSGETAVLAANSSRSNEKKQSAPKKQLIYHVQPGDTLWNISQRHDNIPVEQIKKLNKLKSNSIKPGQKLILG